MITDAFWFKSSLFEVEPGEDEDINPNIYGRQLAPWLQARLREKDYQIDEVFTEDWGWCLVCTRTPHLLYVGCCGQPDDDCPRDEDPPTREHVIWTCFAGLDRYFWKGWFQKIDTQTPLSKLDADLHDILRAEPAITIVDGC